jgi:hypothetical protein
MRLLSQSLEGRSGVSSRARVLWEVDRGSLPRLSLNEDGYHNETIFPHAGGEESRKQSNL